MSRFLTDARLSSQCSPNRLADFYREEFLKHRRCLEAQRDSYSEPAIAEVEAALTQVLGRLDTLCRQQNCDKVISALLRKFDALTGLSAWSDPKTYH